MNKTMLSILKVLDSRPETIMGSREISRHLTNHGIELTERTVRYHLRILDERGYTRVFGKEGRMITSQGREELSHALVSERVGFVINRIETLSFLSDFGLSTLEGSIILNISFFPEKTFPRALQLMKPVFASGYTMSDRVVVARGGEQISEIPVPSGQIGFGTVCSVTINSILMKAGIPMTSRFGGVLQVEDGSPTRFVALISYEGSSHDPLELFINSSMTEVTGAAVGRSGKILASFREIPLVCAEKTRELKAVMESRAIGGILAIGNPNQPLLEMPVGIDKTGVVVVGGLNPVAAAAEAGIPVHSKAMSTLFPYSGLVPFQELL